MRHGKSFNHLGRTAPHRQAMLSNMASSLIQKKRITTTVAKAKALRKYVEPIITKAKDDTTQSRRVAFSYLQDKGTVQMLFDEVAAKVADRPGGYTRIIKLAEKRLGDNSDMCIIELVDYNSLMLEESAGSKTKTRRSRRGGGSKKAADNVEAASAEGSKEKKTEPKKEAKAETSKEVKAEAKNEEAEAKKEGDSSAQDTGAEEKSPKKDDKNKEGKE